MAEVPEPGAGVDVTDQQLLSWVVADALTQLSPEHRAVLLECYFRGPPVREAARHLGRARGHRQVAHALRAAGAAAGARGDGGGAMSCEFEHDDGAYVLGALSPADRRAFEEHLSGCDRCQRSVRELAGLPGLLARVDAGVLSRRPLDEPVPASVLPALLHDVRRDRRRRTLAPAGVAAAAARRRWSARGVHRRPQATTPGRRPPSAGPPAPSCPRAADVAGGYPPVRATSPRPAIVPGAPGSTWSVATSGGRRTPPDRPQATRWTSTPATVGSSGSRPGTRCPARRCGWPRPPRPGRTDITSVEVRTTDGDPVLELAG